MGKRHTIDEIKDMIYRVHGDTVRLDESTYIAVNKKALFIDKEYGEWWTKPEKVIYRKQGHKKRSVEKAKKTFVENYGVDSPLKNKKVREKLQQTCMKRYGVDNPAKNKKIREKMSESIAKRSKKDTLDIVNKRKATCMKRYGASNPLKNKDIKSKAQKTLMRNYGVTAPSKSKEILEKIKETCMKRYGVDNPSKSPEVIKKIEDTMLKKYGTKSSMQNHSVAKKNARAQSKSVILKHWMSDEDIVCVASYEIAVVEYFNNNMIRYEWQPKTFMMPNGKTYRPDCYLCDEDRWIEIKGFFRKDAEEKWKWFHSEYPNSELWNKRVLKNKGII